jgi:uroporphyrinogen-III synthase
VRLLVTRPSPDDERTAATLRALGHEVLIAPMLHMQARACEFPVHRYAGVVMTSANAARAIAHHPGRRDLARLPVFAVGHHTAQAALAAGFHEVHCANGNRSDLADMLRRLLDTLHGPLLYLAGEDRAGEIELAPNGTKVVTAVVYRMVKVARFPAEIEAALRQRRIEGVLHFSRRSCQAYLECAKHSGLVSCALTPLHFCISPQVAEPLVAQYRSAGKIAKELAAHSAGGIRIAPRPDEASLIGIVEER